MVFKWCALSFTLGSHFLSSLLLHTCIIAISSPSLAISYLHTHSHTIPSSTHTNSPPHPPPPSLQYAIDDSLPFILNILLAQLYGLFGTLVVTCYGLPWFTLLLVPLGLLYYHIQKYYRRTSRYIILIYKGYVIVYVHYTLILL